MLTKQHDPRTGVSRAQDFRGQMIRGGKAAQSRCLRGLLLAALSSSPFFFFQINVSADHAFWFKCAGHGSLLGLTVQRCPGKDCRRCLHAAACMTCGCRLLGDVECGNCLSRARLCTLQLLQEWEEGSQKRGVSPRGGF